MDQRLTKPEYVLMVSSLQAMLNLEYLPQLLQSIWSLDWVVYFRIQVSVMNCG